MRKKPNDKKRIGKEKIITENSTQLSVTYTECRKIDE